MSDLKTSYPSYFRWEVPRSERVGAAGIVHQQRTQVQERSLVQRFREQIGNLLFGWHPVDGDHELQVELTTVAHPNLIVQIEGRDISKRARQNSDDRRNTHTDPKRARGEINKRASL